VVSVGQVKERQRETTTDLVWIILSSGTVFGTWKSRASRSGWVPWYRIRLLLHGSRPTPLYVHIRPLVSFRTTLKTSGLLISVHKANQVAIDWDASQPPLHPTWLPRRWYSMYSIVMMWRLACLSFISQLTSWTRELRLRYCSCNHGGMPLGYLGCCYSSYSLLSFKRSNQLQ
jgi:hypothetical protein